MDDSPGIPREILGFSWMVHQNSLGNPRIFMDVSPNSLGNPGFPWIFHQIPWEILGFSWMIHQEFLGKSLFSWMVHPNSLGNPRIFMDFSPNSLGILRMVPQVSSFVVRCRAPLRQSPFLGANTYDAYGFVRLVPHISFETTRGGTWGFGHSPFEQRPAQSHIAGGGGRYRYR